MQQVVHDNIDGASKALIDLHQVLPEVCISINTKQASRIMLNAAREKVQDLQHHGMLPATQAASMIDTVETQMRKLQFAQVPL